MPLYESNTPHYVSASSTGGLNVTGDGTSYVVKYNTVNADPDGAYNGTTGVFTAKLPGLYTFDWNVTLRDVDSGGGYTNVWTSLVATGGTFNCDFSLGASGRAGGSYLPLSGSVGLYMNLGDVAQVEVVVYGGAKTVGVYATAAFNTLTVSRAS